MIDIVEKMLEQDVLDAQAAEQVRTSLAEGNSFFRALLASGLAEEKLLRYLADHFN